MKKILLLLLIFVSGCTGVFAQQFDYGKIAPHPRLLLPEGGEEAIKKAIAEYPPLAAVHQRIMELCDRTLTESPVERIKEGDFAHRIEAYLLPLIRLPYDGR